MSKNEPEWLEEAKRRARYHATTVIHEPGFEDYDFEDLVQDFLAKLISAMRTFRPKAKPSTYIERTFRNYAIDLVRQSRNRIIPESLDCLMADLNGGKVHPMVEPCDDEVLIEHVDLLIDLGRIIPKLPLTSRTMICVLEHNNLNEAVKKIGHKRHVLMLHVCQLREELIAMGIRPQTRKRKKSEGNAEVCQPG